MTHWRWIMVIWYYSLVLVKLCLEQAPDFYSSMINRVSHACGKSWPLKKLFDGSIFPTCTFNWSSSVVCHMMAFGLSLPLDPMSLPWWLSHPWAWSVNQFPLGPTICHRNIALQPTNIKQHWEILISKLNVWFKETLLMYYRYTPDLCLSWDCDSTSTALLSWMILIPNSWNTGLNESCEDGGSLCIQFKGQHSNESATLSKGLYLTWLWSPLSGSNALCFLRLAVMSTMVSYHQYLAIDGAAHPRYPHCVTQEHTGFQHVTSCHTSYVRGNFVYVERNGEVAHEKKRALEPERGDDNHVSITLWKNFLIYWNADFYIGCTGPFSLARFLRTPECTMVPGVRSSKNGGHTPGRSS